MAWKYERLSAQDTSFLLLEDDNACLHVASVGIFERGPLATPDGGIDFEKIERSTRGLLPRVPRYRQKLQWIPLQNHPVWVDDATFNLHYHLRHTALPRPGSERQLKRMAARIMSQPLDHSKPLWENWVVEGLEGDRFAVISKIHHCMIDGMSGMDLANKVMSSRPDEITIEEPRPFVPRAVPSSRELLTDEIARRASLPFALLQGLRKRGAEAHGDGAAGSWRSRARSIGETLRWATQPPGETPLNAPIGAHRRFDWLAMDLLEVRAVRKSLGGSINDVVLAIVAGAVRRYFTAHGVDTGSTPFKVMTPVSVRGDSDRHTLGNRVSAWLVDLPIGESDPRARIARVTERTAELKQSQQAVGTDLLMQATDWLPGVLFALGARAAGAALPFNMVVTNVPGPQSAWYMLGARLLESYGMVPLIGRQGLGVALGSYDGRLFRGFNADWEIVPDLHDFVIDVERSFDELCGAAGVKRGVASPAGADPSSLLAEAG